MSVAQIDARVTLDLQKFLHGRVGRKLFAALHFVRHIAQTTLETFALFYILVTVDICVIHMIHAHGRIAAR